MYDTHVKISDDVRIFCSTNFKRGELEAEDILIVFNYGLVCSNAHWKYQIPFFDKMGLKVLSHDYRFHHQSTGTKKIEDCTFEAITNDLGEVLEHFEARQVFMIGHSMGVNITLEFAKKNPEKVLGMILISGTVVPPHDVMFGTGFMGWLLPYLIRFKSSFPHTFEAIWQTQHNNPLALKIIQRGGFNTDRVDFQFVYEYMQNISKLSPEIFFQLMEQMRMHDIIKHLHEISAPALVVGGDQDYVIPNRLQEILMHHLPNAEMYIVKDGSHVPQVDFPDTLNQRMQLFYEKVNRR